MASLVMNPGTGDEKTFPLPLGITTIGRTKDNGVYCLHKSLSRRHAQVDFDGIKLKVLDLQSKNGIFYNGRRVGECELLEGQSFRCGDVTFLLEGGTVRSPRLVPPALDRTAQTLPSPIVVRGGTIKSPSSPSPTQSSRVASDDDPTSRDRLFLLIRASELLVGQHPIDKLLDELVLLVVQVLDADRIAVLTLDETTMTMRPRVMKTRVPPGHQPFSKRVVDWIVQSGSPASFADVARDGSLPGDASRDYNVRSAMAAPIDAGGGTIGVVYTDNLSTPDVFRADDLALLRAVANFAAVAIESAQLRAFSRR